MLCFHSSLLGLLCCVGKGEELKAGGGNCVLIGPSPNLCFVLRLTVQDGCQVERERGEKQIGTMLTSKASF